MVCTADDRDTFVVVELVAGITRGTRGLVVRATGFSSCAGSVLARALLRETECHIHRGVVVGLVDVAFLTRDAHVRPDLLVLATESGLARGVNTRGVITSLVGGTRWAFDTLVTTHSLVLQTAHWLAAARRLPLTLGCAGKNRRSVETRITFKLARSLGRSVTKCDVVREHVLELWGLSLASGHYTGLDAPGAAVRARQLFRGFSWDAISHLAFKLTRCFRRFIACLTLDFSERQDLCRFPVDAALAFDRWAFRASQLETSIARHTVRSLVVGTLVARGTSTIGTSALLHVAQSVNAGSIVARFVDSAGVAADTHVVDNMEVLRARDRSACAGLQREAGTARCAVSISVVGTLGANGA